MARRLLSESELRARLVRRRYAPHEIDDAVDLLRSYGYINDETYAEAVLREAMRTGRGPLWVEARLRNGGVAEAIVHQVGQVAQRDELRQAQSLVANRFGEPSRLEPGDQRRAYRFLLTRGFAAETALRVLGEP